jgi:hypothetical protein
LHHLRIVPGGDLKEVSGKYYLSHQNTDDEDADDKENNCPSEQRENKRGPDARTISKKKHQEPKQSAKKKDRYGNKIHKDGDNACQQGEGAASTTKGPSAPECDHMQLLNEVNSPLMHPPMYAACCSVTLFGRAMSTLCRS